MDQVKIGEFIAKMRHENELTQKELSNLLNISDKAVSKWETGKGLPDVSIMLPLCEVLHITVNELLSGTKLADDEYKIMAEENMISLVNQKDESKKKMILSFIVGGICVVAVTSLSLLAGPLNMPVILRIVLIVLTVIIAILGVRAAAVLDRKWEYLNALSAKKTLRLI